MLFVQGKEDWAEAVERWDVSVARRKRFQDLGLWRLAGMTRSVGLRRHLSYPIVPAVVVFCSHGQAQVVLQPIEFDYLRKFSLLHI